MRRCLPLLILITLAALGCNTSSSGRRKGPPDWLAWQAKRHNSIAGTNGWTTLVARHWLDQGRTSVGADPTNQFVLPRGRAAEHSGSFIRNDRSVRFEAAPGVAATLDGSSVQRAELTTDLEGPPSKLMIGDLSFVVIERGERLGLRVRDPESPTRLHFNGLRYFTYDPNWRIEGRFEPFTSPRNLRVPDVIGSTQEFPSPGAIVFSHGGVEHRLDVVEERGEEDFFVIFKDRTAGGSTYAAGRFLYVAKPDSSGRVTIDFNRAYTPPCGFTSFATCPLPPRQNWLPIAIRAGELKPFGPH